MKIYQYGRIWLLLCLRSLARDWQYRRTLWLSTITGLLWGLIYLLIYELMFGNIATINGWTKDRALVLALTFLLVNTLFDCIFEINFRKLPSLVYEGGLEYVLTKPLSSQFLVSVNQFSYRKFFRVFFIIAALILVIMRYEIVLTWINAAIYAVLIIISLAVVYGLWFMSISLVFWMGNIENIDMLFHPIFRMTFMPLDIFTPTVNNLLFFLIPLAFIATIPAKGLIGLISGPVIVYGLFAAVVLLYASARLWRLALKQYTGVSS